MGCQCEVRQGVRRVSSLRAYRRAAFDEEKQKPAYSISLIISRAIRAKTWTSFARVRASADCTPCFKAFLLALGAPPRAPCILQTL
jgi:hypothetical protein